MEKKIRKYNKTGFDVLLNEVCFGPFNKVLSFVSFVDIHFVLRNISKTFRNGSDFYLQNNYFNLSDKDLDRLLHYQKNRIKIGENLLSFCYRVLNRESVPKTIKLLNLNSNEANLQNFKTILDENDKVIRHYPPRLIQCYFHNRGVRTDKEFSDFLLFLVEKKMFNSKIDVRNMFTCIMWSLLNSKIDEKEFVRRVCIFMEYTKSKKIIPSLSPISKFFIKKNFYLNIIRVKFYLCYISSNCVEDKMIIAKSVLKEDKKVFCKHFEFFCEGIGRGDIDKLTFQAISNHDTKLFKKLIRRRQEISNRLPKSITSKYLKKIIKSSKCEGFFTLKCVKRMVKKESRDNFEKLFGTFLKNGRCAILKEIIDYAPQNFFEVEKNYKLYPKEIDFYIGRALKMDQRYGIDWKIVLIHLLMYSYPEELICKVLSGLNSSDLDYSFDQNKLYRFAILKNYEKMKCYLYPFVKSSLLPRREIFKIK